LLNEGDRFGAEFAGLKPESTRCEPEFLAPSSRVLTYGEPGLAGASVVVSVETGAAGGSCFASSAVVPWSSLSGEEDSFSTISALSEEDFSESAGSRSGSEIGHKTKFRISIEK